MKRFILILIYSLLLPSLCFAGFNGHLKADTAVTIKLGPFLDDTDGNTAETALTISQADVRLSKNGGNFAQKNQADSCTHDELGYYDCSIDATDTDTEGRLKIVVHESGALLVVQTYMVMNDNSFEAFFENASELLTVDITQIATSAVNTASAQLGVNVVNVGGTAQTANDNGADINAILTDTAAYDTDAEYATAIWNAATASYGGAGTYGQAAEDILADTNELQGDWTNTGRLDTIIDSILADTGAYDTDGEYATAIWNAATATYGGAGTYGQAAEDTLADTNELQGDWVDTGRLDTIVDSILTDTGTTLQAEVDGIQTDTEDIQSRIPAALSSGNIKADVLAISGATASADALELSAGTIIVDTIAAGYSETPTTLKGGGIATLDATDDHYNGRIIIFTSGNLQNQATNITDYDGTTKVFTFTALTEAPADTDGFIII